MLCDRLPIGSKSGTVPTVTELYGWGPWVNGGAWIETHRGEVDFIYRNLDQVERVIAEGENGIWRHDYDQQAPFGFRSVVYFGETKIAIPLYDPNGEIAELKRRVARYPEALRNRIVEDGLWGAEFSLWACRTFAARGDVLNAAGAMTRVAHLLVQALFALNREYFVSDKYATGILDGLAICPDGFPSRLAKVLGEIGRNSASLLNSVEALSGLWKETAALSDVLYQPRFVL